MKAKTAKVWARDDLNEDGKIHVKVRAHLAYLNGEQEWVLNSTFHS